MAIFGINVIIKMAKIEGKCISYYMNGNIFSKCNYKYHKKMK